MSARAQVLELAILGRLNGTPMHGYEIRKQLNATLGAFRTLSYGSLYPALKSLTARGLIAAADSSEAGPPLAGRRARIVYRITDAGLAHLEDSLATAGPATWDDDATFDVRFALFGSTDATTRLRILEGRRARMVERTENLRLSFGRASRRMDVYTAELARHGLEQVEREVEWLERVIDTERGTRGALDYGAVAAAPADHPADPPVTKPADHPVTNPPAASAAPAVTPQISAPRRDTSPGDAPGGPELRNEIPMSKEQA